MGVDRDAGRLVVGEHCFPGGERGEFGHVAQGELEGELVAALAALGGACDPELPECCAAGLLAGPGEAVAGCGSQAGSPAVPDLPGIKLLICRVGNS
jgi:hypothetical protein